MLHVNPLKKIEDSNIKICFNCKHHIVVHYPVKDKICCKKFYAIDLVSGKSLFNEDCSKIRSDQSKCGTDGTYFEPIERLQRQI